MSKEESVLFRGHPDTCTHEVVAGRAGYSPAFVSSPKLGGRGRTRKMGHFTEAGVWRGRLCLLLGPVLVSVFTELIPSAKKG